MTERALVFLDFDGVICDSAFECGIVSLRTLCELLEHSGESCSLTELHTFSKDHLLDTFCQLRGRAITPADFFSIWLEVLENLGLSAPANVDGISVSHFEDRFFQIRSDIKQDSISDWLALNRIYSWVQENKSQFASTYIVSSKDKNSICEILTANAIPVDLDNVFSTRSGKDKAEIISGVLTSLGVVPDHCVFVDDHPANIQLVAAIGVQCFFANWGYGQLSGDDILNVVTQSDMSDILINVR